MTLWQPVHSLRASRPQFTQDCCKKGHGRQCRGDASQSPQEPAPCLHLKGSVLTRGEERPRGHRYVSRGWEGSSLPSKQPSPNPGMTSLFLSHPDPRHRLLRVHSPHPSHQPSRSLWLHRSAHFVPFPLKFHKCSFSLNSLRMAHSSKDLTWAPHHPAVPPAACWPPFTCCGQVCPVHPMSSAQLCHILSLCPGH